MKKKSIFFGRKKSVVSRVVIHIPECTGFTLKATITTTAADNNFDFFFLIFQRKQILTFHVNCLQADSHEMSRLIFSLKQKKIK